MSVSLKVARMFSMISCRTLRRLGERMGGGWGWARSSERDTSPIGGGGGGRTGEASPPVDQKTQITFHHVITYTIIHNKLVF